MFNTLLLHRINRPGRYRGVVPTGITHFDIAYPFDDGVGANGDTASATNEPYQGWYAVKSAGTWVLYRLPDDALFQMGVKSTSYQNPALYADLSFEVTQADWASGRLHINTTATNNSEANEYDLNAIPPGGALHADGSLAYGPISDPTGGSQTGWFLVSSTYADRSSHSGGSGPSLRDARRCEESFDGAIAVGDELWICWRQYNYPAAQQGLAAMRYNADSDLDQLAQQLCHDVNALSGLGAQLAIMYRWDITTTSSNQVPRRSFCVNNQVYSGAVVTGSISGTTMTVTAVDYGTIALTRVVVGDNVSGSPTVVGAVFTASFSGTTMTVTAVSSGTIAVGQPITGTSITVGTTIAGLGTGSGGTGTYTISASHTLSSRIINGWGDGGQTGTGGTGTYKVSTSQTVASTTLHVNDRFTDSNSTQKNQWIGGTSATARGSYTGTWDPNWSTASSGVETWIVHAKFHYTGGQFYTKVWHAAGTGQTLDLIVNDTTNANLFDVTKQYSPVIDPNDALRCKGSGVYLFNSAFSPVQFTELKFAKRRQRNFLNKHQYMLNAGYTEDTIAAALQLFVEGD